MSSTEKTKQPAHFSGHRKRLRERFRRAGGQGIHDYELLELILCRAMPRGDVKPLAKQLLAQFDNFNGVIKAPRESLLTLPDVGERIVDELHLVDAAITHALRINISKKPLLSNWQDMFHYCQQRIGYQDVECLYILFLDAKHKLIQDELLQKGTINHNTIYPREILKRAMQLNAISIVLVHNHPSGDPEPSEADIKLTKEIASTLKSVNIKVQDHVIVARGSIASFQKLNLLRELDP